MSREQLFAKYLNDNAQWNDEWVASYYKQRSLTSLCYEQGIKNNPILCAFNYKAATTTNQLYLIVKEYTASTLCFSYTIFKHDSFIGFGITGPYQV